MRPTTSFFNKHLHCDPKRKPALTRSASWFNIKTKFLTLTKIACNGISDRRRPDDVMVVFWSFFFG